MTHENPDIQISTCTYKVLRERSSHLFRAACAPFQQRGRAEQVGHELTARRATAVHCWPSTEKARRLRLKPSSSRRNARPLRGKTAPREKRRYK